MRVVITGGAGFIGANLVHYWRKAHPSDRIVVLDALTYAGVRNSIQDLIESKAIDFVLGDVADRVVAGDVLRNADLVVHLAAESHVDRSIAESAPFLHTNVIGTHALLELARKLDLPRFHHVSTDEVFGSLPLEPTSLRFDLTTPYNPRSPYAASKAASDHLVRAFYHTYGLSATISNCGNNYGPYQHPEKFIPNFITRLIQGRTVPLYGNGSNVRDWIHVEDHCGAIDLICRKGRVGETYLIGAGEELSNREVTLRLLRTFGRPESDIEFVRDRPGHDLRYSIDPSFLSSSLGWRPRISFGEGLPRTIEWYRQNEAWWKPLLGAGQAAVAGATRGP